MGKRVGYILMSLAIASLVMAIFAFFFPVQSNYIKGNIEGAMGFTKEWYTYSYSVSGGYLMLLAAVSCVYAAIQFNKDPGDIREVGFWTVLSVLLMVSVYYAGKTLFNSWMPGVPSEIQSALGTPYADYRVLAVNNIPQLISSACIVVFALTAVAAVLRMRQIHEDNNEEITSPSNSARDGNDDTK